MLKVKKLDPKAILPTVAHPGEDLGYDLYALEDTVLIYGEVTKVRTGIAAQARQESYLAQALSRVPNLDVPPVITPLGLLIRDRSSMAAKGIVTSGGVIDHGYTGEIAVLMTNQNEDNHYVNKYGVLRSRGYNIKAGDKIAQMVPVTILTGQIVEVEELTGQRGDAGFGSTGQ